MTDTAENVSNARRMFIEHHGMLRTTDAIRLGVHPRTLYTLRDSGELEQVGRAYTDLLLPLPSAIRTSFRSLFAFREQLSV